jgi:hypothetical protein
MTMNVNGIGGQLPGVTASGASPIAGGRFDGQWQYAMNDTSALLGMSRPQLDSSVAQATNLSTVAAGKGVSEQKLLDTIKQGLQQGGSQLSGARLDRIATRIAHQRHAHGSWNTASSG